MTEIQQPIKDPVSLMLRLHNMEIGEVTSDGDSETGQSTSSTSSFRSIEDLPAELRDEVFSHIPDLPTLIALIKASPVMYHHYRHNQGKIIRACMCRELEGLYVDAYASLMVRQIPTGVHGRDQHAVDFLDKYRKWLGSGESFQDALFADLGELYRLVEFHVQVVHPLARMYTEWALANLGRDIGVGLEEEGKGENKAKGPGDGDRGMTRVLSRSEERRLFQAIYRHEIFSRAFGFRDLRAGTLRADLVNTFFFGLFEPWECEAIGCFNMFLRDRYQAVLDQMDEDVREIEQKLERRGVNETTHSAGRLKSSICHMKDDLSFREHIADRLTNVWSLKVAVQVFTANDPAHILRQMKVITGMTEASLLKVVTDRILNNFTDATVYHCLKKETQAMRRREMAAAGRIYPRDAAEGRGDALTFTGDEPVPVGPPIAWVLSWKGRYFNLYGGYVPESLRRWGYVMWDEKRWNMLGARGSIADQWDVVPKLWEEIRQMHRFYGWSENQD